MSRKSFINLPIKDLAKTVEFWTRLGFTFVPEFTDDQATCMVIGEDSYAMLVTEPFFDTFVNEEIADTSKSREVLVGLSAETREEVDELTDKAIAGGGKDLGGDDQGFMYMRGFLDVDGHQWSFIHMDMAAAQG